MEEFNNNPFRFYPDQFQSIAEFTDHRTNYSPSSSVPIEERNCNILVEDEQHPAHPAQLLTREKPRRQQRKRIHFTREQKARLNKVFSKTWYPTITVYSQLSQELAVPVSSIKHWFKNRRFRFKTSNPHSCVASKQANSAVNFGCGPCSVCQHSIAWQHQTGRHVINQPHHLPAACQSPPPSTLQCQLTYQCRTHCCYQEAEWSGSL